MIAFSLSFQMIFSLVMLVLYLGIKDFAKSPIVARSIVLVFLFFAFLNVEGAKDFALVYILFIIASIVLGRIEQAKDIEKDSTTIGRKTISGRNFIIMNYFIGVVVLLLMFVLQTFTQGLVVGVPLAMEGFGLIGVSSAALAENSLFITLFALSTYIIGFWKTVFEKLLMRIPILNVIIPWLIPVIQIVAPVLTIAFFFGVFHITAYSQRVAALLFAASVMTIWLVIYKITGSTSAADISHWGWNFIIYIMNEGGVVIG